MYKLYNNLIIFFNFSIENNLDINNKYCTYMIKKEILLLKYLIF